MNQMQEKIKTLQSVASQLSASDRTFAANLIANFVRFGSLTTRQEPYVQVLIDRATAPAPAPVAAIEIGEFQKVVGLFEHAKSHLKYPKIVLNCDGKTVILSLNGDKSKAPGFINIKGEGGYGNAPWYGRVSPNGSWEPSRSTRPEMLNALRALLTEFGNDPAGIAKKYGTLTGTCCFCGLKLTDTRSTELAIGSVQAADASALRERLLFMPLNAYSHDRCVLWAMASMSKGKIKWVHVCVVISAAFHAGRRRAIIDVRSVAGGRPKVATVRRNRWRKQPGRQPKLRRDLMRS